MNSTNRTINRLFLIVIGIVLVVCGLAAVAVTTLDRWERVWRSTAPTIGDAVADTWRVGVAFAGVPQVPWLLLVIPVAALLVIVALLVFIFAQGRGRTSRVVENMRLSSTARSGTLTVDTSVAADVIERALTHRGDVAVMSVSAYRVKRRPALKVTVTPRRGADPVLVLARVEDATAEWDRILGARVPVFIHLNGGVRSALSRPAPRRNSADSVAQDSVEMHRPDGRK